jgi:unsaturated chondroitin disaccharide hydrolase
VSLRRGTRKLSLCAAATVTTLALLGCGSHGGQALAVPTAAPASGPGGTSTFSFTATQLVPSVQLPSSGQTFTRILPASPWALSFDVQLGPNSTLKIGLGSTTLALSRAAIGPPVLSPNGTPLAARRGWLEAGGSRHFEISSAGTTRMRIDGQPLAVLHPHGTTLSFSVAGAHAAISALIISPLAERGALLLHRLAELHARVALGTYPGGADLGDNIHYDRTWMSGFWPGALWQAAAIEPAGGMFARWALQVTLRHLGGERTDSHDVGFMYGQSSLAGWRALCDGAAMAGAPPGVCSSLLRSTLRAADELLALAASNPGAGTIPMTAATPVADTIIDSTMNIAILPWASAVTGNRAYDRVASHHAHKVAQLLVRPDGSTAQAVYLDRASGHVINVGTHQGLSDTSTWSRGQAWAVYGFAQAAAALRDHGLLDVANRVAAYVARQLPPAGIPLWDYNAPPGAPVDVSAGTITASGLIHLAAACRLLGGPCPAVAGFMPMAHRMLAAALMRASTVPPLGLLRSQVLNERGSGPGCWCNNGELIFGVTYALEALRLLDPTAPPEPVVR